MRSRTRASAGSIARLAAGTFACLFVAATGGCASVALDVRQPVPVAIRRVTLAIRDETRGDMSDEQLSDFESVIASELRAAGIDVADASGAPPGDASEARAPGARVRTTAVVGKVLRYDPGNRLIRYVTGYGFGTGSLKSAWEARDPVTGEPARCVIEGSVSLGTFGGSIAEVEQQTGEALARFLRGGID
ncbi:MAG TPA: hypothetical protein VFD92_06910 [Candidatus Binatia bacterium]|nr:hypothetical protein [Candidatus Binatia bacterium]